MMPMFAEFHHALGGKRDVDWHLWLAENRVVPCQDLRADVTDGNFDTAHGDKKTPLKIVVLESHVSREANTNS